MVLPWFLILHLSPKICLPDLKIQFQKPSNMIFILFQDPQILKNEEYFTEKLPIIISISLKLH